MTKSRLWTTGTALVVVAVLALGWFLLVSPKRSSAADLKSQATEAEAANMSTEASVRQLKLEQKQLPAQRAQIAAIKRQIPSAPLEPSLIRQVTRIASDADVDLASITPNPLAPVAGTEGVQFIGTSIVVGGDFSKLKAFLDGLEENERSFLVTGFNIAPSEGAEEIKGDLVMTVSTRVFVASTPVAAAAAATTTTPAAGASAGATPSATPAAPTGTAG